MAQLIYQINSGYPNFTAHIEPNEAPNQIHSSIGIYSFDDIPTGEYSLTVTDGIGCEAFFDNIQITTTTSTTTEIPVTTTTTTTGYVCDYSGVLTAGLDGPDYGYIKDVMGSLVPLPIVYDSEITDILYSEGYLYVYTDNPEIIINSIQINAISYNIVDGMSELIDNPFEEGLDYNICVQLSLCSPEVWVCDSGEITANGGYCNVGITNGKDSYIHANYYIFWYVQTDFTCWVIRNNNTSEYLYFSEEDVATPNLVNEWHIGDFGILFPEIAIGQSPLPSVITQACETTTTTTTLPVTTTTTTTCPPVYDPIYFNYYIDSSCGQYYFANTYAEALQAYTDFMNASCVGFSQAQKFMAGVGIRYESLTIGKQGYSILNSCQKVTNTGWHLTNPGDILIVYLVNGIIIDIINPAL